MLFPGDQLCAFLDDVHALCPPERGKPMFDAVARALFRVAGIRLHLGKTKVWNKGGVEPEPIHTMGENAWHPSGIMVLGTPIGSEQFVATVAGDSQRSRSPVCLADLVAERQPRSQPHIAHPPTCDVRGLRFGARRRGLWETARCWEIPHEDAWHARNIATLPMRMGGRVEVCSPLCTRCLLGTMGR